MLKESLLSERQKELLALVVESHIQSAQPVGSRVLLDENQLPWSSATVRNELAELETEGYLSHLHTSSGRVPTDKGYRFYIDCLIQIKKCPKPVQDVLTAQVSQLGNRIGHVLHQIAELVSQYSSYTGLALTVESQMDVLKKIHLVLLEMGKVLVVLLNSVGIDREFVIACDVGVNQESLDRVSQFLSQTLEGERFSGFDHDRFFLQLQGIPELSELVSDVLKQVRNSVHTGPTMTTTGLSKLLDKPEFEYSSAAKEVLAVLEDTQTMTKILDSFLTTKAPTVVIGKEHDVPQLEGCSLVTVPVLHAGQPMGVLGLLGPKRMAYNQVLPLMYEVQQVFQTTLKGGFTHDRI